MALVAAVAKLALFTVVAEMPLVSAVHDVAQAWLLRWLS